jgi:hypothetical protein
LRARQPAARSYRKRKPRVSRGTDGLQTRRWRKPDSNSRSHPAAVSWFRSGN